MTDRQHAMLELIAAKIALEASAQGIKRSYIGYGKVSPPTVTHVLTAQNYKLSTLFDVADSLGCDVVIELKKRVA